jgi:hypothetical protein
MVITPLPEKHFAGRGNEQGPAERHFIAGPALTKNTIFAVKRGNTFDI